MALPPMNPEVARLRRKSAQRKYVKRLRYVRVLWSVAGVLLLVLALEVVLVLTTSPRFWIFQITVSGGDTITVPEVLALSAVPAQSNYYRTSLRKMAQRITTGDARVKSAGVYRGQIGVLQVMIEERRPVCRLGSAHPPRYVDGNGILFTRPTPPTPAVPIVEGITAALPVRNFGKRVNVSGLREVLACLAAVDQTFRDGSPLEVARVIRGESGRLTLVLQQGTQVLLGEPRDFENKMFIVQQVILYASTNNGHALHQIEYIDARVANRGERGLAAYYKPRGEEEGRDR